MTKYIAKNCFGLNDVLDAETKEIIYKDYCINANEYCSNITDCPIKQVARISDYYDIYCNHCVTKNCENCHFDLAKVILQTLDVQEEE